MFPILNLKKKKCEMNPKMLFSTILKRDNGQRRVGEPGKHPQHYRGAPLEISREPG